VSGTHELMTIPLLRWQCPKCGRFIKEAAIREENYRDFTAYYGVGTRTFVDCGRCGTLEMHPRLTEVGSYEIWENRP